MTTKRPVFGRGEGQDMLHRVIDGTDAARFVGRLGQRLGEPDEFMLFS